MTPFYHILKDFEYYFYTMIYERNRPLKYFVFPFFKSVHYRSMIELRKWNSYLKWNRNLVNFESLTAIKKPVYILDFFLGLCTLKIIAPTEMQIVLCSLFAGLTFSLCKVLMAHNIYRDQKNCHFNFF